MNNSSVEFKRFEEVVAAAVNQGYSDIHLAGGLPFIFRKEGIINFDRSQTWAHKEIDALVAGMLTNRHKEMLRDRWSVDFALTVSRVRLRINVFNTTRGLSMAVRILPGVIPSFRALNLHPSLQAIAEVKYGLVLVCGATGSGKSTTIAAIIEEINQAKPVHIITLEDPIEYRLQNKRAFVEQREVGIHVPSYKQGLTDALRENPDIIVVGEIREAETARLCLSAAETGHLVIASLHATDAEDAVYRLSRAASNEAQESTRFKIASTISWLVVQGMSHIPRYGFRVPVLSILRGTPSIRSLIRENKLAQLETAMHTGRGDGMFTAERYLEEFINLQDAALVRPYKASRFAEIAPADDYATPLVDPDALHDVVYMTQVEDKRSKKQSATFETPDSLQYEIGEAPDLEEVIAQMEMGRFNSS